MSEKPKVVVIICSGTEWDLVVETYAAQERLERADAFEWFTKRLPVGGNLPPVAFVFSGAGKIDAASGTQFAIDRWQPSLVVNFGTCGGFDGDVDEGNVILAMRTAVYDIAECSDGQEEMEERFTTDLALPWLKPPYPLDVKPGVIISADRDLRPRDIPRLREHFNAVAADWESAAVAHVAKARNGTDCLIVRAVSDVVSASGSIIYGNKDCFREQVRKVMPPLLESLPDWLGMALV